MSKSTLLQTITLRAFVLMTIFAACFAVPQRSSAQIVEYPDEHLNADSLRRAFADKHYYFGLYKDNYFIFGPPVDKKPAKDNTNIKFQISIAQKLTKATLPGGTYLYLFYSQKVFWNILENSMPMTDLNFNPGVGLTKPIFIKNRFVGKASVILEHESNGRDGDESRSWNKLSFAGSVMVDPNFVVSAKFWIPIIDGVNNKDILKYCGIYQIGWQFQSASRKFSLSSMLTRRAKGWFNYNVNVEAAYRWSTQSNQYLFLQFYCGYGEGLLEYKTHTCQARVGIVIKPSLFSEF
jgi:phospholipase A1